MKLNFFYNGGIQSFGASSPTFFFPQTNSTFCPFNQFRNHRFLGNDQKSYKNKSDKIAKYRPIIMKNKYFHGDKYESM